MIRVLAADSLKVYLNLDAVDGRFAGFYLCNFQSRGMRASVRIPACILNLDTYLVPVRVLHVTLLFRRQRRSADEQQNHRTYRRQSYSPLHSVTILFFSAKTGTALLYHTNWKTASAKTRFFRLLYAVFTKAPHFPLTCARRACILRNELNTLSRAAEGLAR